MRSASVVTVGGGMTTMLPVAWRPVLAIALGAVLGAWSRYYGEMGISYLWGSDTPLATLVVNLTGCGAMGFATRVCFAPRVHPEIRLLWLTGFMGSYTTFSGYELDSIHLRAAPLWGADILYWAGSILGGWLCLELGQGLAGRYLDGRRHDPPPPNKQE
ncbi:fluoride efflux transporter FluC [Gloeomargarita sp.]